jgi:aconitase A
VSSVAVSIRHRQAITSCEPSARVGVTRKTLQLTGEERIDVSNLQSLQPGATVPVTLTRDAGPSFYSILRMT